MFNCFGDCGGPGYRRGIDPAFETNVYLEIKSDIENTIGLIP